LQLVGIFIKLVLLDARCHEHKILNDYLILRTAKFICLQKLLTHTKKKIVSAK